MVYRGTRSIFLVGRIFRLWLLVLFLLSVIPVGNETSKVTTVNRFIIRSDHLLHLASTEIACLLRQGNPCLIDDGDIVSSIV